MEPLTMWIVGIAIFLLPFVLMAIFNGVDLADSRGRPLRRRWRTRG